MRAAAFDRDIAGGYFRSAWTDLSMFHTTLPSQLLLLTVLLCAVCAFGCKETLPSDSALERNFYGHEAEFNKLIEMSQQDSDVVRIAPTFTRLKDNWGWPRPDEQLGFSEERWEAYKKLFRKLRLKGGMQREEENSEIVMILIASSRGIVAHGDSKGYAYSTKQPGVVVDSTDGFAERPEGRTALYKKIKDNWYLFYFRYP